MNGARGLSLLELLVSIVLTAIIAAFLASTFLSTRQIDTRSRQISRDLEGRSGAYAALNRIFGEAIIPDRLAPDTAFAGTDRVVRFAALVAPAVSGGGFLVFELACEGSGDMAIRWRSGDPRTDPSISEEWSGDEMIWPDRACEEIAYLGPIGEDGAGEYIWLSAWSEERIALPLAISLSIKDKDGNREEVHVRVVQERLR